jgi:tRNA-2-methylthio-N6-dimethylallyladenosine synthase
MRVYVETYGCQMNVYDSAAIAVMLSGAGHEMVGNPGEADAVIVNTCAVRERAERRVIGRLRHLRGLIDPSALLGVVGCVAQMLGDGLLRDVRGVSFVVGTDQYARLPEILAEAARGLRSAETTQTHVATYDRSARRGPVSLCEFVSVMRGCDNFCSYCIVPYVRGRERSRPPEAVLRDVRTMVAGGARDVTLIGQNVNSYAHDGTTFAGLLGTVARVPDLQRVRFATSHPKDLTDDVIECVAERHNVCEHIHLPLQSGSDRILAAMNRSYTSARYEALVERIRARIPGVSVTTDVIVGFPGETRQDFEQTLSLMQRVRFDSAFMFRYSVRAGTRAADFVDDVPETEKIARLRDVIQLQKRLTETANESLVGKTCEVLVEGPSKKDASMMYGKTRTGKAVVFPGAADLAGRAVDVRIESVSAWTLHGKLGTEPARSRSGAPGDAVD